MKRLRHSNVMLTANNLVTQGLSQSQAWIIVKLQKIDIRMQPVRDTKNRYDHNAVAVVATVRGKGYFCMGYLPRAAAALLLSFCQPLFAYCTTELQINIRKISLLLYAV